MTFTPSQEFDPFLANSDYTHSSLIIVTGRHFPHKIILLKDLLMSFSTQNYTVKGFIEFHYFDIYY